MTSDGLKLFPHIKRICNEQENIMMQVEDLHHIQSGIIRIGTFSSEATHWLPAKIKSFKKDYPILIFNYC